MNRLKKLSYNKFICALPAALIVAVMYVWLLDICNIVPYGDNNRLLFDMKRQYIDFYGYYKTLVTGMNNILYSSELSLGGGAVSFFAYYISSPFMLIVMLFENTHLPEAVNVMACLKLSLSAYCCDLFLQHFLDSQKKETKGKFTILFSICYAFSSYLLAYSVNLMWMDVFMMMPVVIWMLDRLLDEKKKTGYILCLAYTIYCNYYISYMVCLFIVMWTLFRLLTCDRFEKKEFFTKIWRVFYCSIIAVLLNSWFLFTTISELTNSPKDISTLGLEMTAERFGFTEIFSKIFMLTFYRSQTYFGTPLIYAGILIIILTILYFMNSRISKKERIGMALMLAAFIISFFSDFLNLIWHGGMEPSGYPFREAFMYVFLIIVCSCSCINNYRDGISIKKVLIAGGIVLGFFLFVLTKKFSYVEHNTVVFNSAFIVGYTILLILYFLVKNKKKLICLAMLVLTVITVGELQYNAQYLYHIQGTVKRDDNSYFVKVVEDTTKAVKVVKEDNSFYRVENYTPRENDDAMMYDYHTITHYSSAGNLTTRTILTGMGFGDTGLMTGYGHNNTCLADMLLGIRYLMSSQESPHAEYPMMADGNMKVYRNPYDLSVANIVSVVDTDMTGTPFEIQEKYLEAILGKNCNVFVEDTFNRQELSDEMINGLKESLQSEERDVHESTAIDVYSITAGCDGNIYFFADVEENNLPKTEIYVNGKLLWTFSDRISYQIVNLGYYEKGEEIEFTAVTYDGDFPDTDKYFVTEDMAALSIYYEEAKEKCATIEEISSSKLIVTLPKVYDNTKARGVMLTMPCDSGWKIAGNKEYETSVCLDNLLFIPIEAFTDGQVTIQYVPHGWYAGICTSVLALIMMPVLIYIDKKKIKA